MEARVYFTVIDAVKWGESVFGRLTDIKTWQQRTYKNIVKQSIKPN
jgi:hypothetical protein